AHSGSSTPPTITGGRDTEARGMRRRSSLTAPAGLRATTDMQPAPWAVSKVMIHSYIMPMYIGAPWPEAKRVSRAPPRARGRPRRPPLGLAPSPLLPVQYPLHGGGVPSVPAGRAQSHPLEDGGDVPQGLPGCRQP